MAPSPNPPITLFHYAFSPWSQKITTYLNLRGLTYQSCDQPVTLPRPDLKALGVTYRRIPVLSIGKDIYCDTLIMLEKFEQLYPYSAGDVRLSATNGRDRALERLLEKWTDVVVFKYAAAAIPTTLDAIRDKNFIADRTALWGRDWAVEHQDSLRPEGLTVLRGNLEFLEGSILDDGRDWIQGGNHPTLADIHAAWIFVWLSDMDGALPDAMFSAKVFPKCHAWFQRYKKAVAEAKEKNQKNVITIDGKDVIKQITEGPYGEPEGSVDSLDPSGLKKGDLVEGWPVDTGFSHHDKGKLVALNTQEAVIESKAENGTPIRVHHPRWQFAVGAAKN